MRVSLLVFTSYAPCQRDDAKIISHAHTKFSGRQRFSELGSIFSAFVPLSIARSYWISWLSFP